MGYLVHHTKRAPMEITSGRLSVSILLYALPVMCGTLVQTLFNAVDMIVLGQFGSVSAVSAVGVTAPLVSLFVMTLVGMSSGIGAVMARLVGAADAHRVKSTVGTTLLTAVALGLLVGTVAVLTAPAQLHMIHCPEQSVEEAALYLRIYFASLPFVLLYNFGAAIIRATGDSARPLYYLIASGGCNAALNILLCLLLPSKVAAVAVATFASQALGAVLVLWRLCRMEGACRLNARSLRFDRRAFVQIMCFGIPCALTESLFSLSNLQIQSALNTFGEAAIAGNAAATSLEGVLGSVTGGFSTATLVFVGQNHGAGKPERVRQSMGLCFLYSASACVLISTLMCLLARPLLGLYVPGQEQAIAMGMLRMSFIWTVYAVAGIYQVANNAMRALGVSALPALLMIVSILGFRFVWLLWVYPSAPTLSRLFHCYPLSWILNMVFQLGLLFFVWRRYLREQNFVQALDKHTGL